MPNLSNQPRYVDVPLREVRDGDETLQAGAWHRVDSVGVMRHTYVVRLTGGGSFSAPISHRRRFRRAVEPAPVEVDQPNAATWSLHEVNYRLLCDAVDRLPGRRDAERAMFYAGVLGALSCDVDRDTWQRAITTTLRLVERANLQEIGGERAEQPDDDERQERDHHDGE